MATRREKVILELEDQFTSKMARAAAATAVLDKNLNSLSGSAVSSDRALERSSRSAKEYTLEMAKADEKTARLKKSLRDQAKAALDAEAGVDKNSQALRQGSQELDKYSGRLRLIAEAATVLGPALVPIGAVGIPALVGLTAGLGAAAGAIGTVVLAFNGLGDAMTALDAYQLEPTTANLEKLRATMDELGPAGAEFARYLNDLGPQLQTLQNIAQRGMFPGFEQGIDNLLARLPEVQTLVANISAGLGDLAADAGSALAGSRFSAFFDYLENDARPTMEAFARSTGYVIESIANLLVAFAPLTRDFTGGLEEMTQSLAEWSANLGESDGFRGFVAYIRQSGPQVIALLGSLGNAFVAILQAAAPVGAVVVPALTALAKILTIIANSPIGPALFTTAAAMITLSRATQLVSAGMAAMSGSTLTAAGGLTRMQKAAGLAAAALAGLAILDEVQDSADRSAPGINALTNSLLELSNTGTGKLPEDLDKLAEGIERLADPNLAQGLQDSISGALGGIGNDSLHDNAVKQIEAIDQALTSIVSNQGADVAARALEGLGKSADLSESEMADLVALLPSYEDAVAGAAGATNSYTRANESAARVTRLTRSQVTGLSAAMEENRKTALGAFDAVTKYGEALAAARKRAKESNAGLDSSTAAGRENRKALSDLAAAWNNQGDAIRNNMGKWREARKNFIDTATAMGTPIAKARELANRLLEIPKQRVIDIKLYGGDQAADAIARVRREMASIKDKTVRLNYYVNQVNSISRPRGPVAQADGGSVPKTGLPYADRHHYLLADGEEVISNRRGQADRYRPLLKAINNAADGATVGGGGFSSGQFVKPDSIRDAVTSIADLRLTIRGLNKDIRESDKAIRQETHQRDKLSNEVDRNQAELDRINGLYDNLAGTIGSGLAANQFEAGNAWTSGGGLPDILAKLQASTTNADAFTAASGSLSSQLSGAALESVLRQGLGTVQQFAGLPPAMLAQYQAAFDQNAAAVSAASAAGAGTVYGDDREQAREAVAKSQAELQAQTTELRLLTQQNRAAEKQRDRAEKILGQVKDILGDLRTEAKKNRGEAESGTRSKR